MGVFVNSNYDSGNIEVINITNPLDHVTHDIDLKIHAGRWVCLGGCAVPFSQRLLPSWFTGCSCRHTAALAASLGFAVGCQCQALH